jgi:hypothetical protein
MEVNAMGNFVIDYSKIAAQTGCNFDNPGDVLYYLQSRVGYLATHNKNLTNKQYYAVCDIESILNAITEQ